MIDRKTHTIDAASQSVGRVATQAARILCGKHKAAFDPRVDAGDIVRVINAARLRFTGRKLVQKDYLRHTMYPGGLKRTPMLRVFEKNPAAVVRRAVMGMLPKNNRRTTLIKRLIVEK